MMSLFVWIVSAVLGSSLLSLQSPKLYTDTGAVFDSSVENSDTTQQTSTKEGVLFSSEEIAELNDVLQQKALESSLAGSILGSTTQSESSQKGPAGIIDGLQTWLRHDKNEIQPLQVKTVQKKRLFGENGSSTQIFVFKNTSPDDVNKVLSFSINGDEQYSIGAGTSIDIIKGEERKSWSVPQEANTQDSLNIVSIRTENVFGITDVFFNGTPLYVKNGSNSHFSSHETTQFGDLTVGSFNSDVPEVIQFDRQISEDERRYIETYLRLKYNINLQDGLADMWDSVENKAYSHNMMSLMRNDRGDFNRLQGEILYDDGSIFSVSLPQDIPDENFAVVGDNNEPHVKIPSSHPAFAHMLQKTWKTELSPEVDTISIAVRLSEVAGFNTHEMALMIAGDTDFTHARMYEPTSIDNGLVTFSHIYVKDEAYFTFASGKKILDISPYTSFKNANQIDPTAIIGPGGVGGENSGLALWLRADKGVQLAEDHVVSWLDQSGRGNDFTADLPYAFGTQPQYIQESMNYYPAIRFNHNRLTDYLGKSNFDIAGENKNYTQFVVYKQPQTDRYGGIISYASEIDTNDFLLFNPAELWLFKNGKEQKLDKNSADGRTHIVAVRNNELVGNTDVYLDGSGKLFHYGTSGHQPGGTYILGQDQDSIGGDFDPEQAFTGDISEVIIYHQALSDIDMLRIQSYLAHKYGMTLPTMYVDTTQNLIWDDTKNSRYNVSVFGIGRENVSGIEQKISRSQNNSLITVKNPQNLDDGEFMMFGSSADSNQVQLSHIWLVQKKGDVGAVDISFDMSQMSDAKLNKLGDVVLRASSDETFTQSRTFSQKYIDGYVVTFTNVNLDSNMYISLAPISE